MSPKLSGFRNPRLAVPEELKNSQSLLNIIPGFIVWAACIWIATAAGLTLAGWWLQDTRLIQFPSPPVLGTMMPLTAISLLTGTFALWLVRDQRQARGLRLWISVFLACLLILLGSVFLAEYIWAQDLSVDEWLFPQTGTAFVIPVHRRPALLSVVSMLSLGLVILCLDAKSQSIRYLAEALVLFVAFIMLVRLISYFYREVGVYAPHWHVFGLPVFSPMAPKTAACFFALALGIMFARPQRGLAGLYLARGPAGTLARWLLPIAVLVPVVFGSLGLVVIRANLQGSEYPLSLVVGSMVVLLLLVNSLNARKIHRVYQERSYALATLGERERVLRGVFDNAGAGVALIDVDGRAVVVNKTLQRMLGYSEGEMRERAFTTFTHPDDTATDEQLFAEILAGTRDAYRVEKRYARKDGTHFWAQLSTSVARGPQNELEFVIGMVEDITERKEAEEALGRFKTILDATPDFVGISDAQTRALYVNRAGREMTGLGEDIAGLFIPDFHPTDAAKRLLNEAVPQAGRAGVWTGESELLGANGEHIPVSQVLLAHKKGTGDVEYYSTIMRDITEHKQFEDAGEFLLEASRAFAGSLEIDEVLRSITSLTVPSRADYCAVDLIAPDGSIERAAVAHADPDQNRLANELRIHPLGRRPDPMVKEVMRQGEAILIREVTADWLEKLHGHLELFGQARPRSVILVPLRGRDRIIGVMCMGASPNRRRFGMYEFTLAKGLGGRAALALDNARLFEQSREATRLRDEVLRVVAHDLRNPLNTISLSSDLLSDQLPEAARSQWASTLEIIRRSVTYADRLIEDLLDVARMQAGKLSLERRPTDPRGLLKEAIELQAPAAKQRSVQLKNAIVQQLPAVHADRHRLLQVLSNLIGNAIRFSPSGTTVLVSASEHEDELSISITDEGHGVSEYEIPHLFDAFWQARKGTGGTGLGLAIAKGIVEAHGGEITVRSKPEEGSTFTITLPLANHSHDSGNAIAAD